MNIFFSVIIPTYNQGDLLNRCLQSVFSQTYNNYEVIIIDNNSTDKTKQIIKKFKNRIIYKKINNNGIIAKSRNLGIKISKGNWLSFLDSDDEWKKNKLECIYKEIKKKKIDVICNDELVISAKSIRLWSNGPNKKDLYSFMLKYGNLLSTSASSVRKKFLHKNKIMFNEDNFINSSEDYDFFLNIAKKKGLFKFLPKPLGFHYFHNNNISSNVRKHKKSIEAVLKQHVYNLNNYEKSSNENFMYYMSNLNLKYDILDFIYKKNKIKFLIKLQKNFNLNPYRFFCYISFLLMKFIRNKFFYLINIKEIISIKHF